MKRFLSQKKRVTALAVLFAFAASVYYSAFGHYSICDRCGIGRTGIDWHVPMTNLKIFSTSNEKPTPLSQTLTTNGIVTKHEHHWLFASGAGNGVTCAIGKGRHLSWNVNSEEFAKLIQQLHLHQQPDFCNRVLSGALDPEKATIFHRLSFGMPLTTASDDDWKAWVEEKSLQLDEELAAMKPSAQ